MSKELSIILHLGAPKCGGGRLQQALSSAPEQAAEAGPLSYTALRAKGAGWTPLAGKPLRAAALRSLEGRIGWPDAADPAPQFAALDRIRQKAGKTIPVVSNPGWIGWADSFAEALPHWFDPEAKGGQREGKIGLCAFVRPPLDWLNAAYWQWGVWSGRGFGSWLAQMGMPYTLGAALTRWAELPNTDLRLELSGQSLDGFDRAYGTSLPRPARARKDLPPALLGFLMRNRRYRTDAWDETAEHVFRRWCEVPDAPPLWAVLPRHLRMIEERTRADVETLLALAPGTGVDPRWTSEAPYDALLRRGLSPLDDPEDLAALYRALVKGVAAVAEAAGRPMPPLPPVLSTRASAHTWDVAVAQALEHLLALDAEQRGRRRVFGL